MSDVGGKVISMMPPIPPGAVLSERHREHLRASGLTDAQIDASRAFTEESATKLAAYVRWSRWSLGHGLVFPFFVPGRAEPVLYRVRPDRPLTVVREGKEHVRKYEQPKDVAVQPFFPPGTLSGALEDTSRPVLWVEGEKKALALDQLGHVAIGGTGVYAFHDVERRRTDDVWALHPTIRQYVAIAGREHRIVFDSDAVDNDGVMTAARRLAGMIESAGGRVGMVTIPHGEGGAKLGIDDYLVAHGEAATRALLDAPGPIASIPPEEIHSPLSGIRALRDLDLDKSLRLPYGYSIDRDGAIWRTADREGADDKMVARTALVITRIVLDLYSGEERVELAFRRRGRWKRVLADRKAVSSARSIVDALAPHGAPVESGTAADVVRWLADLEHVNERRLARTQCVTRCGWHELDERRVFVAPGLLEPEGLLFDERAGRATVAGLGTRGDADAHARAIGGIFAEDRIAATAICGALAATILHRIDAPNFAIHLAGDSSRGKSTMLRGAASLFGDPESHTWVASWNTTQVGLEMRAHILGDLPFCVDEAGVADERMRQASVYMLINGSGRSRGQKDGGLRATLGWRTVVLSTGERDLVREDANTGAQTRVMQLWVDGIGGWGAAEVDAFNAAVRAHHGHIGRHWLAQVEKLDEASWDAIRTDFKTWASSIARDGVGIRARQAGYIATLMVAERLANLVFGWGSPTGETMLEWASEGGEEAKRTVESAAERALREVGDWITATRHQSFARLEPDMSGAGTRVVSGHVRTELCGYIRDDVHASDSTPPCVWVLPRALDRVLREHGHDRGTILREWRRRGWVDLPPHERLTKQVRVGNERPRIVPLSPEIIGLSPVTTGDKAVFRE